MKNAAYLLLVFIFIIFLLTYLSVALSIPVDGDGALHAATVKVIAENGELIDNHPYTITDGSNLLPIFYPKLFYTEMASIYQLIGDKTFTLIVPIFGILSALFIFIISRWLFKSFLIASLSTIIVLSSYGLSTNSTDMFRMETMIVLLVLGSIYSLLRYTEKKQKNWLICSILLLSACLATKQQTYMYLPIFLLIIFTKLNGSLKDKLVNTFIFFSLSFLIASPLLIEEFFSTGTFFYPGIPLIGGIEKQIANLFDLQLYSVGDGWVKYGVGSDRINNLEVYYGNPYNHLLFLNPFYSISPNLSSNSLIMYFYIPLLVLGSMFTIIRKHFFLVIFLIFQQLLLFVQPLERYFLLNQILVSIIIGGSIGFLELSKIRIRKYIKLLLLTFIVALSTVSASYLLSESLTIPDYSWGNYIPGRIAAEAKAGEWLQKNSPPDAVIITPRTHVFSYYSRRKALWINQLGGKDIYEAFLRNDINSIHKIMNSYKHSYLIIPSYWVVRGEADGKWVSYIESDTVEKIKTADNYFENVYKDENITIFKNKRNNV